MSEKAGFPACSTIAPSLMRYRFTVKAASPVLPPIGSIGASVRLLCFGPSAAAD
jgi:hypothetical protein